MVDRIRAAHHELEIQEQKKNDNLQHLATVSATPLDWPTGKGGVDPAVVWRHTVNTEYKMATNEIRIGSLMIPKEDYFWVRRMSNGKGRPARIVDRAAFDVKYLYGVLQQAHIRTGETHKGRDNMKEFLHKEHRLSVGVDVIVALGVAKMINAKLERKMARRKQAKAAVRAN
jgi:hypothetical protein